MERESLWPELCFGRRRIAIGFVDELIPFKKLDMSAYDVSSGPTHKPPLAVDGENRWVQMELSGIM